MSRFVRQSKYRHVFGQPVRRELHYDNIRVSASAWDTDLVSVNPKYLAVNYQVSGGGAFIVVPLDKPGKLPDIYPLVRAHSAPVLDTAWNPFDDSIIASAGEDSRIQITRIDDALLEAAARDLWQEDVEIADLKPIPTELSHGGKKVGHVKWHPTASGLLASASANIRLWDVEKQKATIELVAHPDFVQSMCFNSTGALLATTCRDKKLRMFDVRASNQPVQIAESHSGVKGSRVCWLGSNDRLATTGFSRMSDRQVFLWDTGSLDKPIKQLNIDTSSGTLMPFWSDNNVLFLAGKGDGNCRYYEYENGDLVYLTEYNSRDPQRGITFLPRRALNISDCEIARAYKVSGTAVEPVSFIVPRKSDSFQSDIFPPAPASEPAMSAADFFNGKTSEAILLNLDSRQTMASPDKPTKTTSAAAPSPAQASTPLSLKTPSPSTSVAEPAAPHREPSVLSQSELQTSPVEAITKQPISTSPQATMNTSRQASTQEASRQVEVAPKANNSEAEALHKRIAELEGQLDERDGLIRTLELKVEKMTSVYNQAKNAFSSMDF